MTRTWQRLNPDTYTPEPNALERHPELAGFTYTSKPNKSNRGGLNYEQAASIEM